MKQPSIAIFGKNHKVMQIEFNNEGIIEKLVYQVAGNTNKTVFRGNVVMDNSLKTERKIQGPTQHPYHNYALAPDLEQLLC